MSMKVNMRNGFSDRNAIKSENTEIQLKDFDKRTRVQIYNMFTKLYQLVMGPYLNHKMSHIQDFFVYVLGTVYSETIDPLSVYNDKLVFNSIQNTILNDEYDDVLTLIEAIVQYFDSYNKKEIEGQNVFVKKKIPVYDEMNDCLKKEYVGYRFVNGIIVQISDDYEIGAINEALSNSHKNVYDHISKANKLLADRNKPDYENSIKESISAVEAMGELITGIKGKEATLGNLLKKLENKGVVIHKGLQSAFNTLYGYTSDANGIRHAGNIGGPASTFEEAKFMLVACCAFVNYLLSVSSETN